MTLLVPVAHFSPKAWVVVGDIAQKPPHMTIEHDLGPGKTTSNPFALQKQTSLLHRVVEGGAQHSTLSMNMRAHGDVGKPVNNLYYNNLMSWRHRWEESNALDAIIKHFQANVNGEHPKDHCFAQVEFTHARATTPPSSSSKVNLTHAKWIIEQVDLLLKSKLTGVGKNAQKPITILVVAAYKEQVVDLKMRFLDLARELKLDDEQRSRVQFKTVDNSQGDEADFVFFDLVTTTTPGFVAERYRLTLGYSRSSGFLVVLNNRGNFVGHERNEITGPRALELSRAWKYLNDFGVTKRIVSCKRCETHKHTTDQCDKSDPDMHSEVCERTFCGEEGHTAAFCHNRRCGNCAQRGHSAGECPLDDLLCSQCGKQNHDFFNCTTSSGKRECSTCNERGHTHWGCRPTEKSVECRRCGKWGHKADDCDQPAPCSSCNESGHTKEECPQTVCRFCGEKGHMKATCPLRVCRKCGQPGHIGPDCPYLWCNRCHSVGHTPETCQGKRPRCSKCRGPHHDYACRQGIKQADRPLPPRVTFHPGDGSTVGDNGGAQVTGA